MIKTHKFFLALSSVNRDPQTEARDGGTKIYHFVFKNRDSSLVFEKTGLQDGLRLIDEQVLINLNPQRREFLPRRISQREDSPNKIEQPAE